MSSTDPAFERHRALAELALARCPAGELAHDAEHVVRVYRWALRLAPEAGASPDLAGAAALVHDLVFVPKDGADRAAGGERSAAAAPEVLTAAGYAPAEILIIAAAVRTSSWSRGLAPMNPEGAVLQDADRLDAIGAIGLLRTAACGQFMSRPDRPGRFYDPQDPLAVSGRSLDDRSQVVDHLPAKLLKLAAGMHTATAQREAARRHAWLEDFRRELAAELSSCAAGLGPGRWTRSLDGVRLPALVVEGWNGCVISPAAWRHRSAGIRGDDP